MQIAETLQKFIENPGLPLFILRITVGIITLKMGYKTLGKGFGQKENMFKEIGLPLPSTCASILGILELLLGLLLLSGTFVRPVSLSLFVIFLVAGFIKSNNPSLLQRKTEFFLLLAIICFCLFITGGGIISGDLYLK